MENCRWNKLANENKLNKRDDSIMEYMTVNEIIVKTDEIINQIKEDVMKKIPEIINRAENGDFSPLNMNDVIERRTLRLNYDMLPHMANLSFEEYERVAKAIGNKAVQMSLEVQEQMMKELGDDEDE